VTISISDDGKFCAKDCEFIQQDDFGKDECACFLIIPKEGAETPMPLVNGKGYKRLARCKRAEKKYSDNANETKGHPTRE
jgi:hypothetical protein